MRNRPQRSLGELYDLGQTVDEPEMEPATDDGSLDHVSLEKSDRAPEKINSGKFTDQNRVAVIGDMRVESGTCNVCSAPCSSCMHRIAAAMESNADCGSSDNTFLKKDADSCSFTGVEHISPNHLQPAASETSNLLSGSSSNDSYTENAESKVVLRNSQTCCTSEDVDMPLEGSEVCIDNGQKSILLPGNEGDKADPVRSSTSSGELKNEEECSESPTGFGRSESSLRETGTESQPIVHTQASEDLLDVNVCDICGDAGREEYLATCSRCPDGAEHTYCMRIMLKKVPEGDWLCEECQLKEELEIKRLNKESPGVQSLNKKTENFGSSLNMESSPKLNIKSTDPVTCGSNKEMQSPRTTTKRYLDQKDVTPATGKKVCATKDEPLKTSSPRMVATLSRENSLKNMHIAELKRTSMASSPGDQSTSNLQISRSLALDSRENSVKNLHIAELKRTNVASSPGGQHANRSILARSLTLDSKYSNVQKELYSPRGPLSKQVSSKKDVEPKVKKLIEDVPPKLSKESATRSLKRPALVKTFNKSLSFKSASSGHHSNELIKVPRPEDAVRFKQTKEKNVIERKSSFIIDRSLLKPKHLPKLDVKTAPVNGEANNKLEPGNPGSSKGFDTKNNIGSKEVKKQSSFKFKSQGIGDSENKKAGEFLNSEVTISDVPISADPSQVQLDGKLKCPSGASRPTVLEHNHLLVPSQVPEASHAATESCQADKLKIAPAKPCSDESLVDGTGRRNKWKDAVKAAMSREKNSKTADRSDYKLSTNSSVCEDPSRISSSVKNFPMEGAPDGTEILKVSDADYSKTDSVDKKEQAKLGNKWKDAVKAAMSREKNSKTADRSDYKLSTNSSVCEDPSRISSSVKNFPMEGAPDGTEILKVSDADYSKTDSVDKKEQANLSNDSSFVPGVGDENANLDESNEKTLTQNLPDDSSLLKSVTVPEHEFIWQGAFEIIRIGRLPDTVTGIQAHLSNISSPRVHEVARQFPSKIQLEEVPRVSLWPSQFQDNGPKENNIALYFFARDAGSYEKSYEKLVEATIKNDLALKGCIDEVELLIFPSSMLPECSRWNMLFFLWGVFRIRKPESSKPYTTLKEEPCESKRTIAPLMQDSPTIPKYDCPQHPPEELSESKELCGTRIVNSSVFVHSVSSIGPDSITHKANVIPTVSSSFGKASVEPQSSESSDHILPTYPSSYAFNNKETCSTKKGNGAKQGSINEIDVGKISHTHVNSAREEVVGTLPGFSVTSSFEQDCGGSKEIKKQDRPVKIEVDSEEKIKEIDCVSWSSKPNMKRTHPHSYRETSESTKTNMWQAKANFFSIEDDREHKKMKWDGEGHVIGSYRDQHMEFVPAAKIQPPLTSYLYEQQQYGANYSNVNVMSGSSRCAETSFFPVNQMPPESNDSCPNRTDILQNFRHFLPPVDKKTPESNNAPVDLELALGGNKTSSKKEMLPLFYPLADKGRLDEPSGSAVDEDMSGSLSLSLGFPGIERKRNEDHVGKDDRRCTKKSLILFGGVIESFNPS